MNNTPPATPQPGVPHPQHYAPPLPPPAAASTPHAQPAVQQHPQPLYEQPQYQQYQQQPPQYQQPYAYVVPGPGEPFDGAFHPDDLSRPLYGATLTQAVTRFFKNYVNFSGRASRSEFWFAQLALILTALVAGPLISLTTLLFAPFGLMLSMAYSFGLLLPSFAIVWRRLHDVNLAGPLFFLVFVPFVGGIALLVLLCLAPKPEGRRFVSER